MIPLTTFYLVSHTQLIIKRENNTKQNFISIHSVTKETTTFQYKHNSKMWLPKYIWGWSCLYHLSSRLTKTAPVCQPFPRIVSKLHIPFSLFPANHKQSLIWTCPHTHGNTECEMITWSTADSEAVRWILRACSNRAGRDISSIVRSLTLEIKRRE